MSTATGYYYPASLPLESDHSDNAAVGALHRSAYFFLLLMAATVSLVTLDQQRIPGPTPWWERITVSDLAGGLAVLLAVLTVPAAHPSRLLLYSAPFLLWCTLGTVAVMVAPPLPEIAVSFQLYHLAVLFYVFLLADQGSKLVVTPDALKWFLAAFMIGVALQSVVTVHDSLAIITRSSMWFPDAMPHRLRGTFRSNGQLGQFAMAGLFIGFAFAAWPGMKRRWRVVILALASISAMGAFFASRRSALICIGLWLVLVAVRSALTAKGRRAILPLLGLVLLAGATMHVALSSDHYAGFADRRLSAVTTPHHFFAEEGFFREQLDDTRFIVGQYPILGSGIGHAMFHTSSRNELHNGLLSMVAETGLVGLFLLVAFPLVVISRLLFHLWHAAKDTPYQEVAVRLVLPFLAWAVFTVHNRIWRDRGFWIAVIAAYGLLVVVRHYKRLHSARSAEYQEQSHFPTPPKWL